jgi:hypothetical protein
VAGGPRRREATEAGGPSTLPKVVAVSVVQGVGVELGWAGSWEGFVGKRAGHVYDGNRPWLQAYLTSDAFIPRLKSPEVDPRTQGDQQESMKSQCKGRRKAGRRMPELSGGCQDQRKGCQDGSYSNASPRSIATFLNKN